MSLGRSFQSHWSWFISGGEGDDKKENVWPENLACMSDETFEYAKIWPTYWLDKKFGKF